MSSPHESTPVAILWVAGLGGKRGGVDLRRSRRARGPSAIIHAVAKRHRSTAIEAARSR